TDSPLFVNGYGSLDGRYELNTHFNAKLSDKWAAGLYLHGNRRDAEMDENKDGFLDSPLGEQINLMNRWQYQDAQKGWVSFLNLRYLKDEKLLGQLGFNADTDRFTTNSWGSEIDTERFDGSLKLGYVFPEMPFQSLGFQTSYSRHVQGSYFGAGTYDIDHRSLYANLLFNSILGNTMHKFTTGLSFAYDGYDERVNGQDFNREDHSAAAFFEYNYTNLEKFSLTAGVRFDVHNRLGHFFTPRLHARYTPWENGSLRASFGQGRRAANVFAENQKMFSSSRSIQLVDEGGEIYGLDAEKATNFGLGFIQKFTWFDRPGDFSVDFYHTDFQNQLVVDWEDPRVVRLSNLQGKSYASSVQVEFHHEVLSGLELRTAYKFYDVKTDYQSGRLQKPLQAKNRFFANLGYQTPAGENGAQWRFDYTYNLLGEQRLPSTLANPQEHRLGTHAKGYSLMNAQVTKVFSKAFEVYVGGE